MVKIVLIAIAIILLTIGLVWVIDKFVPKKIKPILTLALWGLIALVGYNTFMSVYGEIKFNQLKEKRYKVVIESLKDIRDAQLAHRTVTGKFANNFDNLVKFIDTAQYTITQRRDSTVLDVEATRRFGGVETTKEIIIIDTLGFASVKDSLFGADTRYKTMMNVPVGKEGAKFVMKAGMLEENDSKIPVFEAKVDKAVILDGQNKDFIIVENQTVSVDGVNGSVLKVGSMEEVNTTGNWPKNFSKDQ
jgi:hypothetical protein